MEEMSTAKAGFPEDILDKTWNFGKKSLSENFFQKAYFDFYLSLSKLLVDK